MPVRLVIVGGGAIAEAMHLPAAASIPDVRVEAVVDTDPERCARLQSKFGIPRAAARIEDVASGADAAVLCTPPHVHDEAAIRAFACGLHVLCEKPMANARRACEAMIAAARSADRILAMAHIFRFYPSRRAIKSLLERRALGRVRRVSVAQGGVYSWETVTGHNMRRDLSAGGVLIDAGIHPLDTVLWWCGASGDPEYEDDAYGGLEANARLCFRSEAGYPVDVRVSRTCGLANEFRIDGEEGTAVLSAFATSEFRIQRSGRIETVHAGAAPVSQADCSRSQLLDFVESVRGEHPPAVPGSEGAAVIALIEQCYAEKRKRPLPSAALLPGATW